MTYRRCGKSGLQLSAVSLGLWYNFGGVDSFENGRAIVRAAFDMGVTQFDLANNYGPPPGSAEENFGRILSRDLAAHRNELVITSKAGYRMWPGPYGDWGSRKYLVSSLDASLKRLGVDYVDIFYSHRPDPKTPLEETMGALDHIVRSGRALYAGISTYDPEQTRLAAAMLKSMGTPCIVHQPRYNMFDRWIEEKGLLGVLESEGLGCVVFSPLCQGILTDKYLKEVPEGSRGSKVKGKFTWGDTVSEERVSKAAQLDFLAKKRGQSLAQMALAWVLRHPGMTSAIIGASRVEHVKEAVAALNNLSFSDDELAEIEKILRA